MEETSTNKSKDQEVPERSWAMMIGLALGHALKHFYQQAFLLLIPSFKEAMLLTDVQVGLFGTARTVCSSVMNIPAGIIADMWRNKVGVILSTSLTSLAVGYLIIGAASSYWVVLVGVGITGLGTSLWHAPAFGTLGAIYPNKRATALAIHRMGGSVGDSISPIVVGLLLGGFAFLGFQWDGLNWRTLSLVLVAPALVSAIAILVFYGKAIGEEGSKNSQDFITYMRSAKSLLVNSTVIGMVVLTSVRAMAHNSLSIFLIVYMDEDLGFPVFKIGYHMALLTLLGVISAPIMGWISDKIGRRPVISVALVSMAILILSLIFFGDGLSLTIILGLLGIFLYTVNPVMLASAIDGAPSGTESSVTALMFTGPAIFGAIAPIIAGILRTSYGMDAVFIYAGGMVGFVAFLSLLVPMRRN